MNTKSKIVYFTVVTSFVIICLSAVNTRAAEPEPEMLLAFTNDGSSYMLHVSPCQYDIPNRHRYQKFTEVIPPFIYEGCWAQTIDHHIVTVVVFPDITGNGQGTTEEKVWPEYQFWPAIISVDGTTLTVMNPKTQDTVEARIK